MDATVDTATLSLQEPSDQWQNQPRHVVSTARTAPTAYTCDRGVEPWQFASLGTALAVLTIWQTSVRWRAHGVDDLRPLAAQLRSWF